jgi:hypothetical protein
MFAAGPPLPTDGHDLYAGALEPLVRPYLSAEGQEAPAHIAHRELAQPESTVVPQAAPAGQDVRDPRVSRDAIYECEAGVPENQETISAAKDKRLIRETVMRNACAGYETITHVE